MTTQAMSWHMLAMMGIDVWIAKNQPTAAFDAHSFSRWQDSLQAERDEYCEQSLENQQKHQQLKHQDLKHPITEAKKLSEPMSDAAILTTPSADVILSDVDVPNHAKFDKLGVMNESVGTDIYLPKYLVDVRLLHNKFHLMAIRFHDWLLLMNKMTLTTAELGIAHSLIDKLVALDGVFLEAHYPLMDDVMSQKNAQATLMGFLVRLHEGKTDIKKIGFLNAIDEVDFGQLNKKIVPIPTLKQMYYENKYKRTLWDLLHDLQ